MEGGRKEGNEDRRGGGGRGQMKEESGRAKKERGRDKSVECWEQVIIKH